MKKWLLEKLHDGAQRFGVEVHRSNLYTRADWRLLRFLELHEIDTVLDVGANRGQFAIGLLRSGYKGKIISFEALPHVYDELQQAAKKYCDQWTVAPRCALNDTNGTVAFHVTGGMASSSMLQPAGASLDEPEIFSVSKTIDVYCKKLDDFFEELGIESQNIFLKLDVQGGEQKVLKGAANLMTRVRGLTVEMPFRLYYEDQPLARELDAGIVNQGFEIWDILPVWRQPETGRLDYFDAVYFRAHRPASSAE